MRRTGENMNQSNLFDFLRKKNDKVAIPLLWLGISIVLYRNNLMSIVIFSLVFLFFWMLIRILSRTNIFLKQGESIHQPSFKRTSKLFSLILTVFVSIIILLTAIVLNFVEDFGGEAQQFDSPNYDDGTFHNLESTSLGPGENASFWGTLGDYMVSDDQRSPNVALPSKPFTLEPLEPGQVSVTWLGHSTIFIRSTTLTILMDPVFGDGGAGPLFFGPKPFPYEHTYAIEQLPEIDYVFISHDHYDHLDMDTVRSLDESSFFVPLGVKSHLLEWGLEPNQIQEFDWYDETNISSEIQAAMTPSRHFSGRGLFNGDTTLWASWVLKIHNTSLYFSGDTGYMEEFKTIGERYGPFDLAFLESGQYNEAWKEIHMMPDEVVQAGIDLKASAILPIHNSKFELALHHWDEPLERTSTYGLERNLSVATPMIGQNHILGEQIPTEPWWRNVSIGDQPFLKESPLVGVMLAPFNLIALAWVILPRIQSSESKEEE